MIKIVLASIIIILLSFNTFSEEVNGRFGRDSLFLSTNYEELLVDYGDPDGGGGIAYGGTEYFIKKYYWIDTLIDSVELKKGIISIDPSLPNYWNIFTNLVIHFNNSIRKHFNKKISGGRYWNNPIVFMNKNYHFLNTADDDLTITCKLFEGSGPPNDIKMELERIRKFNLNNPKLLSNIDNCLKFLSTVQNIPYSSQYSYHLEYLKAFPNAINDSVCQINVRIFNEKILLDSVKAMFNANEIEKTLICLKNKEILDKYLKQEAEDLYFLCQIYYGKYNEVLKDILKNIDKGYYFTKDREEIAINCIRKEPKLIKKILKYRKSSENKSLFSSLLKKLILNNDDSKESYDEIIRHVSNYFNRHRDTEIEGYLILKIHGDKVL